MKKTFLLAFLVLIFIIRISAQQTGVAINSTGSQSDPSAILDVSSSTQGMLIPRMTTPERNAITNPADGLLIFNTTNMCFEFHAYATWHTMSCASCNISTPTAGNHIASQTQIEWNWNPLAGAVGYKYNTINDYLTATDNLTGTSYIQSGLTCNTPYTLYIWAYNNCGYSTELMLTQTTSACSFSCGGSVTFTYNGSQVTYGTFQGQNSTCWMDRNLGASQAATSSTDASAYGDVFQWGRGVDGHQIRTSQTTTTLSNNDQPGHSKYIITSSANSYDWRNPQNNLLWQGSGGTNNPCPAGWAVPTESELNAERLSWSPGNTSGAYSSPLKWVASGARSYDGTMDGTGANVSNWSSTVSGVNARYLLAYPGGNLISSGGRGYSPAVRCILN